jgi:hypothetical protein
MVTCPTLSTGLSNERGEPLLLEASLAVTIQNHRCAVLLDYRRDPIGGLEVDVENIPFLDGPPANGTAARLLQPCDEARLAKAMATWCDGIFNADRADVTS